MARRSTQPAERQPSELAAPEHDPDRPSETHGVYGISVAAELVGTGVQTLRLYESRGLLEPQRTAGGTRRYSQQDLARLRRIIALVGEGLNIAGIVMVLSLEADNARLRRQNAELRDDAR